LPKIRFTAENKEQGNPLKIKNKPFVGIILSISRNKINVIENINFVENIIISLKIGLCMCLVVCRSTLYRSHIKAHPHPL